MNSIHRRSRIHGNGLHYIVSEVIDGQTLIPEEKYGEYLIEMFCHAAKRYCVTIQDYLLLEREYHLLIEVNDNNMHKIIGYINANYSRYYNRHMRRKGHFWKQRYASYYLNDRRQLDRILTAMEDAPISYGLSDLWGDYPGTMLHFLLRNGMDRCMGTRLCDPEFRRTLFDERRERIDLSEILNELKEETLRIKRCKIPNTSPARLEDLLNNPKGKEERNRAIYHAYLLGFTQTCIAEHVHLSVSSVCQIVKRYKSYDPRRLHRRDSPLPGEQSTSPSSS